MSNKTFHKKRGGKKITQTSQKVNKRAKCVHVTINHTWFSLPSPPAQEVGQKRAEGIKSKEGSLYLALAGNISPHQCVGDQ